MSERLLKALALLAVLLGFAREKSEGRIEALKKRLRLRARWMLVGAILFLIAAGILGALFAISGLMNIKASSGHWPITAWFLDFSKKRSVAMHSADEEPPPLEDERLVLMGAGHYETACRFCHGSPGEPMPTIPHHMTPHPPPLWEVAGEYADDELYYIVLHGLKFTGMPAWPSQERQDEVWPMVAFIRRLPKLDAEGYQRLVFGEEPLVEAAPRAVNEVCGRCHGVDGLGRGEGAFPKLAGQRPEYLRRSLYAYKRGERHSGIMKPIANRLDDAQIEAVVAWYSARPRGSPAPPPATGRGQEIATKGIPERRVPACAQCHGPGFEPKYPAYPILAGQYAEYLEQQLWLFQMGRRGGTKFAEIMQMVAMHHLEPAEIRDVAAYYASLPGEDGAVP